MEAQEISLRKAVTEVFEPVGECVLGSGIENYCGIQFTLERSQTAYEALQEFYRTQGWELPEFARETRPSQCMTAYINKGHTTDKRHLSGVQLDVVDSEVLLTITKSVFNAKSEADQEKRVKRLMNIDLDDNGLDVQINPEDDWQARIPIRSQADLDAIVYAVRDILYK